MGKPQATVPVEKPESKSSEGIQQELANWLKDLRQSSNKGLPFLMAFLVMRSKDSGRLLQLMKERFDATQQWAGQRLMMLLEDGRDEFDELMANVFKALIGFAVLALVLLACAAFITTLGVRAYVIPGIFLVMCGAFFWLLSRAVPTLVILRFFMSMAEESAKVQLTWTSLFDLPRILFGGASAGVNSGLELTREMWYRLGKIPYWAACYVVYYTLVPLHKAWFTVPVSALTIPILFLAQEAFKKTQRGVLWTFNNWVCAFILVDCWLYSQWSEIFQPILMNPATKGELVFRDQAIVIGFVLMALAQLGFCARLAWRSQLSKQLPKVEGPATATLTGPPSLSTFANAPFPNKTGKSRIRSSGVAFILILFAVLTISFVYGEVGLKVNHKRFHLPGSYEPQFVFMNSNTTRIIYPVDSDWDLVLSAKTGEVLDFKLDPSRATYRVYNKRKPGYNVEYAAGIPVARGTYRLRSGQILATPHDQREEFVTDQSRYLRAGQPMGALLVKFGKHGLPHYAFDGPMRCPNPWWWPIPWWRPFTSTEDVYVGLNLLQLPEYKSRLVDPHCPPGEQCKPDSIAFTITRVQM